MITKLAFAADTSKSAVFSEVRSFVESLGFTITYSEDDRPWGGFFYIDESQATKFIQAFFPHLELTDFQGFAKLSPKILLVGPEKRLSWQYHHRRSEIWKLIGGKAAVVISDTDDQNPEKKLVPGDIVTLAKGERHRLVGVSEWGIVAEIWQHTDAENPSNEDDIVRVEDDFGR